MFYIIYYTQKSTKGFGSLKKYSSRNTLMDLYMIMNNKRSIKGNSCVYKQCGKTIGRLSFS